MAPGIIGSDVGPPQLAQSSAAACSRSRPSPGRTRSAPGPETPPARESRQIARARGSGLAAGLWNAAVLLTTSRAIRSGCRAA